MTKKQKLKAIVSTNKTLQCLVGEYSEPSLSTDFQLDIIMPWAWITINEKVICIWCYFTTKTRMFCRNGFVLKFFVSLGNKEAIGKISLTIEATNSFLVLAGEWHHDANSLLLCMNFYSIVKTDRHDFFYGLRPDSLEVGILRLFPIP